LNAYQKRRWDLRQEMLVMRWIYSGLLVLIVVSLVGCASSSSPVPPLSEASNTERNRVAEMVRMADTLELIAQRAWDGGRLSAPRYQELHDQHRAVHYWWKLYSNMVGIELISRGGRTDGTTKQIAAGGIQEAFQKMVIQAQAWNVIHDVNELKP
jgi:hypothetical protein